MTQSLNHHPVLLKHAKLPFTLMKQTFQCQRFDTDSFELDFSMVAKGFVPAHYHPHMDELFEITGGQGEFMVDGVKTIANPGDKIMVKKGVVHALKTLSIEPMTCRVIYSPCSDTHKMFAIFGGLANDGVSGVKLPLKGEYLCRRAGLEAFSKPPGFAAVIENAVMSVIMVIGKLRNWDRLLHKYLGQE